MVTVTINRRTQIIRLEYPKGSGFKSEEIPFKDNRQALGIWRLRTRSYVMNTMMKYKRQRAYALSHAMCASRQMALNQIHDTLIESYEGKDLNYFLTQIMKLSRYVVELSPGAKSPYRHHYETQIVPMFHWMNWYLRRELKN